MKTKPIQGTVDVWLGHFRTREMFEQLLEEQYEDDDAPISAFSEVALDGCYYDHDSMESKIRDQATSDVRALLAGHSYSDSFANAVAEEVERTSLASSTESGFNAVVLFYDPDFKAHSASGDGYSLCYVGRFDYSGELRISWD